MSIELKRLTKEKYPKIYKITLKNKKTPIEKTPISEKKWYKNIKTNGSVPKTCNPKEGFIREQFKHVFNAENGQSE